jgi:hypothetical protein
MRNVSGGARPRLSWGPFVVSGSSQRSVSARTSASDSQVGIENFVRSRLPHWCAVERLNVAGAVPVA